MLARLVKLLWFVQLAAAVRPGKVPSATGEACPSSQLEQQTLHAEGPEPQGGSAKEAGQQSPDADVVPKNDTSSQDPSVFTCPPDKCHECCQAPWSATWFGGVGTSKTRYKCIPKDRVGLWEGCNRRRKNQYEEVVDSGDRRAVLCALTQKQQDDKVHSGLESKCSTRIRCCCERPPSDTSKLKCLPMKEEAKKNIISRQNPYVATHFFNDTWFRAPQQSYDNPGECIGDGVKAEAYSESSEDTPSDHDRCCIATAIRKEQGKTWNVCVKFQQLYYCSEDDTKINQTGKLYVKLSSQGKCFGEKFLDENMRLVKEENGNLVCPEGYWDDKDVCTCLSNCV